MIDRDGEPWFVLADVCRVLDIGNPSQAATRLDDEERHTLTNDEGGKINGLGAVGSMPTIINESGLWSLVLTSRKPSAKRFKKWVTAEVIPSIRKTGGDWVVEQKAAGDAGVLTVSAKYRSCDLVDGGAAGCADWARRGHVATCELVR